MKPSLLRSSSRNRIFSEPDVAVEQICHGYSCHKVLIFLRGLPAAYESARQTLEMSMEEMILRLTETESRIRSATTTTAYEHANKSRAEWVKSVKFHKCGKKGNIARFCRTPKKEWIKNDEKNETSGDEKP